MSVPTHRIKLVPTLANLISEHHGEFKSILDVGCGELQKIWREIWEDKYEGFDNRDSVGADYVGDACDLSRFKSNSRDVVCSWSTLEHVLNPYIMLKEMLRVSNKTVIFTTDYSERDKNGDPTHLYAWTLKVLGQLLMRVHTDFKVYQAHGLTIGVFYNCGTKET